MSDTSYTAPVRILWLEDTLSDLELLSRLLRKSGLEFKVDAVRNGAAFREALGGEYDVILADYHLPDINGIEALALARELAPEVPVIFVSGSIGEERAIEAVRDGAVDYVLKDRPSRLPNAILRAITERAERETHRRVEAEAFKKLRRQFDQSPIAIFVWRDLGDDFEFIEYNAAAGELAHGHAAALVGMRASVAYADYPALRATMRDCVTRKGSAHRSVEYPRSDGSSLFVELTLGFIDPDMLLFYTQDVTDQRRSQQRIAFQSALLENVQNSIVATDADLRVTYWNSSAERLFGWNADEVLGRDLLDFHVPPESIDFTRAMISTLPELGRYEGDMKVLRKGGGIVPVYATISVVRGESNTPPAYVAVYFDLSDLRREQAARLDNERLLSTVLEHFPIGIRITDAHGETVRMNPAARQMLGPLDLPGDEPYLRLQARSSESGSPVPPEEWPLIAALRTRRPVMHSQIDVINPFGERRSLLSSGIPILDRKGEVSAGVGVHQDVTDQRLAEVALRRSEERFRSLVENLSDVISLLATDGTMLYQSPSVTRALGYGAEELVGQNLVDFLRPGQSEAALLHLRHQVEHPHEILSMAVDFRHRDGSWRSFEVITTVFPEDGQTHVVATARDVTDRNLMERKLDQAQRVTGLGRVAATIAHEINNVLMGILPFAEIVGARAGNDAHLQLASSQINRAMRRGRRITQEILHFTHSGNPILQPVDVSQLINSFEDEARNLVGTERHLSIEVEAGTLWVAADVDLLTQMLSNLLLNARDATTPGGRIAVTCCSVSPSAVFPFAVLEEPERYVHITVRDDGVGMTPEIARRVFDPLFTTKTRGTGLGLSVVHQIVEEAHGGQIFIDSAAGAGTTFHIFLPRSADDDAGRDHSAPQSAEHPLHLGVDRVLLVEDDDAVALGLTMMLELEGFSVSTVGLAASVIPEIERFRPDVVVLDCGLPDGNGLTVFQELSRLWPALPVIFSTGEGDSEAVKVQATAQHVGYLLKPYEIEDLLAEMRRVIVRRA